MKTRNFILLAGVLALTVACNNDEKTATADNNNNQSSDLVPVTLTAQTEPSTRAATTTLNDNYIASNQSVKVRVANVGTPTVFNEYDYTAGENGALNLQSETPPYYPTNGTNINIVAYHPGDAGGSFTVLADQSSDANYINSDLMWSDNLSNVSKSYDPQTLTFAHKLCKIVVTATGVGGVSQINSITLNHVLPTVSFNNTTGATGVASGDATNITLLSGGTSGSVTATAIIPAQTIDGNLITFTGKTTSNDNFSAIYRVDSKPFAANNVYTFTLNVSRVGVTGQNAVTAWSNGGNSSGTVYTE